MSPAPADPDYTNPYAAPKARVRQPRLGREDRPLATRLSRFFAFIIDSFSILIVVLPMLFLSGVEFTADGELDTTNGLPPLAMGAGLVSLVFMIVQLFLLVTKSQTIGKLAMKIRIDEYATDRRAGPVKTLLLRGFVVGMLSSVPVLGLIFYVVNVLFIFGKDQRCLHDLLAGTVVREAP